MPQAVVDYVNGGVNEMVDDASREREVDETDEPGLGGGGVHRSGGGEYGEGDNEMHRGRSL